MAKRSRNLALAAAFFLSAISGASAADNWVGAWGYVPLPPPPGETPVVITPAAAALEALTPLAAPLAPQAPPAPNGAPNAAAANRLLDNPGNLPILPGNTDLANVTLRQLVRTSVAGKQIRLRFSNESSAAALPLGAVHVAEAGPDGSILPGTDH